MQKLSRPFAVASLALAAVLACHPAAAQSVQAARDAVRQALQHQPDVLAKLNAYLAKTEAVDIAKAGWMPRVDLNASIGTDRVKDQNSASSSVNNAGVGLVVSQVLWDGLNTRHAVQKAGHERMSRWFEFVDATEQTAFEAVRALYDVQRQRKLVALADDNLSQHRQAADKIGERVRAGVGRGVDLDQAQARVALAESNLETELANLHDVAARYQRIVGETPSAEMGELEVMRRGLPATASEAVTTALANSPLIAAGIENLRAARADASSRRSAFQPTVEARARVGGGKNYGGLTNRQSEGAVELVMNWNLFNGGADQAAEREQGRLMAQAQDLRDSTCRDVRQNASVAFNEGEKLKQQLRVLARNSASIERARDAYRQQFDIGQRSLLDLLNAENEAYTARRALTNAVFDRAVAHARTLAAMSQLTTQLEIARNLLPEGSADWSAGKDGPARCPAEVVPMDALRNASTDLPAHHGDAASSAAAPAPAPAVAEAQPVRPQRFTHAVLRQAPAVAAPVAAQAAMPAARPAPPAPAVTGDAVRRTVASARDDGGWVHPAGNAAMAAQPVAVQPGMQPVRVATTAATAVTAAAATTANWRNEGRSPAIADATAEVAPLVRVWAEAWQRKDLRRYADLYMPGFVGAEDSASQWMARHRYLFGRQAPVSRQVDGVVAQTVTPGEVETRFVVTDIEGNRQVQAERVLTWREVGGRWRITRDVTL